MGAGYGTDWGFRYCEPYAGLDAKNDPLVKIDEVIPWGDFRPRLEDKVPEAKHAQGPSEQTTERAGTRGDKTRSKVRARVEHVFAAQSNDMGGMLMRCIGLVRAKARIGLKNLVCNMRRLVQLKRLRSGGVAAIRGGVSREICVSVKINRSRANECRKPRGRMTSVATVRSQLRNLSRRP